jgi:hypothetical protein
MDSPSVPREDSDEFAPRGAGILLETVRKHPRAEDVIGRSI